MSETKPAAPEKRPRGRPPRPADQQTRLVAVRLTAAQIERAVALGSGDISAGIRRALLAAGAAPAIVRANLAAYWARQIDEMVCNVAKGNLVLESDSEKLYRIATP